MTLAVKTINKRKEEIDEAKLCIERYKANKKNEKTFFILVLRL